MSEKTWSKPMELRFEYTQELMNRHGEKER